MKKNMEFGVVGLGRMGGNLALQALTKGMSVAGFDLGKINDELLNNGLKVAKQMKDLKGLMKSPRAIFIYVPAGPIIDKIIDQLSDILEKGDLIVDGGNSYWGDSIRRADKLKEKNILFVDLGTSGGVDGARNGACFMAGGEKQAIQRVEPILKDLAVKDGYVHAGPPGAGHFTKLVHNGIEFGMLQAIGEGMDLLKNFKDKLDIPEVLRCWQNGSVIRSWLIDLMKDEYVKQGGMDKVPPYIDDTGEVNWLVSDALHMEVPIPIISQAVMQLFLSRDDKRNWAKAVAMMRHGFGGHAFGADEAVVKERKTGRIGGFYNQ